MATQMSDLTVCRLCGMEWDTNDPEPPYCERDLHSSAAKEIERLQDQIETMRDLLKSCGGGE